MGKQTVTVDRETGEVVDDVLQDPPKGQDKPPKLREVEQAERAAEEIDEFIRSHPMWKYIDQHLGGTIKACERVWQRQDSKKAEVAEAYQIKTVLSTFRDQVLTTARRRAENLRTDYEMSLRAHPLLPKDKN